MSVDENARDDALSAKRLLSKSLDDMHPRGMPERLRHSNIAITLQTYSHVLPIMLDNAAATLVALFMPPTSLTLDGDHNATDPHRRDVGHAQPHLRRVDDDYSKRVPSAPPAPDL